MIFIMVQVSPIETILAFLCREIFSMCMLMSTQYSWCSRQQFIKRRFMGTHHDLRRRRQCEHNEFRWSYVCPTCGKQYTSWLRWMSKVTSEDSKSTHKLHLWTISVRVHQRTCLLGKWSTILTETSFIGCWSVTLSASWHSSLDDGNVCHWNLGCSHALSQILTH